ncbi:nucleotidyltransferase domain-containing protein [Actinomadura sp. ATCC 31491]|uniref:Nucleotidyltransferase domain-containing protein n=1 Tax=Actinomadura luzonensis TaxID=2805427 RepID=A0ABT0FN70_9ACTN|nr:nucleotidyltransferase domain-containing protein [Actinomadura luzonensis]MCK2213742.1 nucleotidyltransferase domain-containing protein [Actinomadura luzonensis]
MEWNPERQLGEAMAAAAVVARDYPDAGVYLGGATTAGLGTPMSDVDVFVVGRAGETRQVAVGERRADVEFVALERFAGDVRDFSRYRCHEDDFDQLARASAKRLDVVVRFCLGRVVTDPHGRLGELRDELRSSPGFARLVIARHSVDCGNLSEDLKGATALRDRGSADFLAQQLLLQAAQALLTSLGDLYMGQKWVWRRWERTAQKLAHPLLTGILTERGGAMATGHDVEAWVRRALHTAQDMLVMAATGTLYDPRPVDAAGARRDPWRMPLPLREGVTLSEPDGRNGVSCSDLGALLWGLSHGRTEEEAVSELMAVSGRPLPREEIAEYYDGLVACGVITRAAS